MNFPAKFIRTINSLNKDANVRVLVNGFRTGQVPINKGVRQGDPLSLFLFLLAVEPLVATINNDTRIEGLGKGRKRNVKCPSYADNLTLTLVGSPSGCLAFEIIGGRVVSASGSETRDSSSTPASAVIYDAYTSITKIFRGNWIKIKHGKNTRHDGWVLKHRRSFTFNKLAKIIH